MLKKILLLRLVVDDISQGNFEFGLDGDKFCVRTLITVVPAEATGQIYQVGVGEWESKRVQTLSNRTKT